MALKRNPDNENELVEESSISGQKAKQLFRMRLETQEEKKILYNLSIEPSFKRELETSSPVWAGWGRRNSVFSQGILKKTW